MYYSTTSILPQRPDKHNNARVKFLDALFKKLAKEKIQNKTKVAAKSVKRSVARFTKRNTQNRITQNRITNNRTYVSKRLPLMSSNQLYQRKAPTLKNNPRPKSSIRQRVLLFSP